MPGRLNGLKVITAALTQKKRKKSNDPMRSCKRLPLLLMVRLLENKFMILMKNKSKKEELYDGFYAVITKPGRRYLRDHMITRQRWEIEENLIG